MSDQDTNHSKSDTDAEPAANIARAKLDAIFQDAPSAKQEIVQAEAAAGHRSKHQKFMHDLTTSGKSLAEIQTAWHNYYVSLPDAEKHEVWQEFYSEHGQQPKTEPKSEKAPKEEKIIEQPKPHVRKTDEKPQSVADVKKRIVRNVGGSGKVSKKQHLHSMLFGLGAGAVVMLIFLFGFFNERFVAPFITPSRTVSSTPIIVDPNSTSVGPETEVIIPKINVEIPVVYDVDSIQENDIQNALERGVVHYATTPDPGQKGNSVIVGHSSNNIFNQGKYKFAFVLLSKLEEGDTFYLTKDGTRYAYRVYEKKIVKPTEVSVLGSTDKPATATLITCDPPGTSLNRLVVIGEQISPNPDKNKASTAKPGPSENQPAVVPGNAPSLWQRIRDVIF